MTLLITNEILVISMMKRRLTIAKYVQEKLMNCDMANTAVLYATKRLGPYKNNQTDHSVMSVANVTIKALIRSTVHSNVSTPRKSSDTKQKKRSSMKTRYPNVLTAERKSTVWPYHSM
jgi:hypothetical protein